MVAVVAAVPGQGWRARYTAPDGTECTTPVLAWLVHADGFVQGVDVTSDGREAGPCESSKEFAGYIPPDTEITNPLKEH